MFRTMLELNTMVGTLSEEFDTGSYLNTNFWETRYWWGGRYISSNGEQQYFADRSTRLVKSYPASDPFSLQPKAVVDRTGVADGVGTLTITAKPSPRSFYSDAQPYVSGMISSYDGDGAGFSQLYGYFEISAKVPSGQGLWPAFWLLPADGSWPPEIDVMELLGADPSTYYFGMHWSDELTSDHDYQTVGLTTGIDLSTGFHTFGVLWEPGSLEFYLDRTLVGKMATPDGLDTPMYLLAGLAVGGTWGGAVDPQAPNPASFPEEFVIDYIKAWQFPQFAQAAPQGPVPTISGTGSNDLLSNTTALSGITRVAIDDVFLGNGGSDIFDFSSGPIGHDIILDFNPVTGADHDILRISKAVSGAKSFNDLYRMIADDGAGHAVLTIKDGSTITFEHLSKADLSYDDFILI